MGNLLDENWIEGQGAEMGIIVTSREVAVQFARIKRQNFKSAAEYRRFLKQSHLTQRDVNEDVRLQILSTAIQEQVVKGIKGEKARERAFTSFVNKYAKRWRERTVCAPEYVFSRCSNSPSSSR